MSYPDRSREADKIIFDRPVGPTLNGMPLDQALKTKKCNPKKTHEGK